MEKIRTAVVSFGRLGDPDHADTFQGTLQSNGYTAVDRRQFVYVDADTKNFGDKEGLKRDIQALAKQSGHTVAVSFRDMAWSDRRSDGPLKQDTDAHAKEQAAKWDEWLKEQQEAHLKRVRG